ncbi:unnamed protein product, partial [Brassica rapa subsp. trilocularis]
MTVVDDKCIRNYYRPFPKMIMSIMNAMLPTTVWKKSDKKNIVHRLKNLADEIYNAVGDPQI